MAVFQPSEEAIQKLVAKRSPRQLAIAYLRVRRQLKLAEDAAEALGATVALLEAQTDPEKDAAAEAAAEAWRKMKGV